MRKQSFNGVSKPEHDNASVNGRYYPHEVVLTKKEDETVPKTASVNQEENYLQPADRLTGSPQDTVAAHG